MLLPIMDQKAIVLAQEWAWEESAIKLKAALEYGIRLYTNG